MKKRQRGGSIFNWLHTIRKYFMGRHKTRRPSITESDVETAQVPNEPQDINIELRDWGKKYPFVVKDNSTVHDLKLLYQNESGIEPEQLILSRGGKELKNSDSLHSLKIPNHGIIHVRIQLPPNQNVTPPFRASPFRASPFRASPFRASPTRASPTRKVIQEFTAWPSSGKEIKVRLDLDGKISDLKNAIKTQLDMGGLRKKQH